MTTADPPAAATMWPTCASSPTVRSVHSTGVPSAPETSDQPLGCRSEFEHLEPRVARQHASARRPARAGDERQRSLAVRAGDGRPRGRRRRARPAASPRRPRARAGRPGPARPSLRARRSAGAAPRGRCARARRAAARGPAGSNRPSIAPSATACRVVTSVRRRCVSRSSRSAASGAAACAAACRRSAVSRSTARCSRARAALGIGGRGVREQPPGRRRRSAPRPPTAPRGGTGSTCRGATGPPATRTAARPARSKRSSKPDVASSCIGRSSSTDRPIRRYSRRSVSTELSTARVLLADDHELVRRLLRRAIGAHPGLEIVGEAADGSEAVVLARQLAPDVVVLDLSMPHMDGFEVAERAPRRTCRTARSSCSPTSRPSARRSPRAPTATWRRARASRRPPRPRPSWRQPR